MAGGRDHSSSSLEFDIEYQNSFSTLSSQPYYGYGSSNDDYLQFTAPSTGIIEVKIHDAFISFGSPIYDYAVTVSETAPPNNPALWTLASYASWNDTNQDGVLGVGETITAPTWSAVDVDGFTTSISPSFVSINSGVQTHHLVPRLIPLPMLILVLRFTHMEAFQMGLGI